MDIEEVNNWWLDVKAGLPEHKHDLVDQANDYCTRAVGKLSSSLTADEYTNYCRWIGYKCQELLNLIGNSDQSLGFKEAWETAIGWMLLPSAPIQINPV